MSADTAGQLREWASSQRNERGEFASALAAAMGDPKQAGPWSLLDIRREFESRSGLATGAGAGARRGLLALVRALLMAGYLAPVLITWVHLRSVVQDFSAFEAANSAKNGPPVNLLTFWSGGYGNAYGGTQLAGTAVTVFVIVLFLIIAQVIVSLADDLSGREAPLPHGLILDAQLHFARTRAMTPQEVTEVVSAATKQLTAALENVSGVVQTATDLVRTVGEASGQLEEASKKLEEMTRSMGGALKPLEDLGRSLDGTNVSIQESTRALDAARVSVVNVTGGFRAIEETGKRFEQTVGDAGQGFREAVQAIGLETGGLAQKIKAASDTVGLAAEGMSGMVRGIERAGGLLAEMSAAADSREPHIAAMARIMGDMRATADTMVSAVDDLRQVLELNSRVNQAIAEEVRRVLGDDGDLR